MPNATTADEASDQELPRKHKVAYRFAATLSTNALRMGLSFITGILLARGLGPTGYGDFNFLMATFISLRLFMDLGSSSAFYTFLSQAKKNVGFYLHYAAWLGLQAAAVLLVVGLLLQPAWIEHLWVGHSRSLVLAAFIAMFFSIAVWKTAEAIAESRRETIWIQRVRLAVAVAHFLLVAACYVRDALNVQLVFVLIIAEYAAATLWCLWKFDWNEALAKDGPSITLSEEIRDYGVYCEPLILTSLIAFLGEYAGRWMLQFYSGSAQQGYFSLGQQFAAVSLLGATSLISIFWKEIAAAHEEGKTERVRHLFLKTTSMLYFAAAVMSCCAIPFSRDILVCFVGKEYAAGAPSFAILLLFPVLQTLGQLTGSYFMAAHQTRKYFLFTVLGLILGTPLCYFLVAPRGAVIPGLELGAFGMALSQVLTVYVSVNLQGWTISRSLSCGWPFVRQSGTLAALLALGFACRAIATTLLPEAESWLPMLLRMSLAATLYLAAALGLACKLPSWTGIDIAWAKEKLKI